MEPTTEAGYSPLVALGESAGRVHRERVMVGRIHVDKIPCLGWFNNGLEVTHPERRAFPCPECLGYCFQVVPIVVDGIFVEPVGGVESPAPVHTEQTSEAGFVQVDHGRGFLHPIQTTNPIPDSIVVFLGVRHPIQATGYLFPPVTDGSPGFNQPLVVISKDGIRC